jgi:hypothetical protein
MAIHDCPCCTCGRRAPVQKSDHVFQKDGYYTHATRAPKGAPGTVAGSITWEEHERAWLDYGRRYPGQSAQRMAERGGFSYNELLDHLGHPPETWSPRGNREAQEAVWAIAQEQRKAGTYTER